MAHGFQILTDDTLIGYQFSRGQSVEHARCARLDDPAFGIRWPLPVSSTSDADWRGAADGSPDDHRRHLAADVLPWSAGMLEQLQRADAPCTTTTCSSAGAASPTGCR
ncbi:MAG: dTDP-4-dehydrorhamnose 3,5-epimerase family protein [Archangiaceae bacterium]|nr:dTDP-4-dehydrorhamnose 3,5-epimerase family protein [Archangiaceae bacterium]